MQIPDYYEFLNQAKILSGNKALEHLSFELRGHDAQKPLVLTSRAASQRGLLKPFIKAFYDSTVVLGAIYDGIRDYAGISLARDLAELFRSRGCDSIIAVGGGAVVNAAKALNILVSEKTDSLFDFFNGAPITKQLKPLVFVPTCETDGLELSGMAKVDNRTIASELLMPTIVAIDPRMTPICSKECAAETGAISLTLAAEAAGYGSPAPMAEAYAECALQILAEFMPKAVRRPGNKKTGVALANAAALASIAHANKPAGIISLIAKELAKVTGHGLGTCMGVLFPFGFGYLIKRNTPFSDGLLRSIAGFDAYASTPAAERSNRGAEKAIELHGSLKRALPESLRALRVQRYLLPRVAEAAAAASRKQFSSNDCLTVLEHAWEGTLF